MKNKNYFIVILVMLINALSYGAIIPLLYPYANRFGINASGMGLLFASFSFFQFLATPIMGRLSDKYGRKPLLLISLLGSAVSLFVFSIARSAWVLFLARSIDGITGGNISVAQAIVSDTTSPKDRAKSFGILGAVFGFGFVFGPALGGLLSGISISAPFLFSAALSLFGVIFGWIFLSETNTHEKKDVKLGKLFDFHKLFKALFHPATGAILAVSFISLIGGNAMIIGFQSYTVDILKLSPRQIATIFTLIGVIGIIMQGFAIRKILSIIKNKVILIRIALLNSSIVMGIISLNFGYAGFIFLLMLNAIISSPTGPVITALISERTRIEDQGGILGLNQAYASLAQIIGPLLAGLMLKISPSYVFLMVSAFTLLSVIPSFLISKPSEKLDL